MSSQVKVPEVKDILKTGLQFGHSTSRWNPKMAKYIFTSKNGIHVMDVVQSQQKLQAAVDFITEVAKTKQVMFVATKRQAAPIVQEHAVRAGAHFVTNRWPGGLFSNFTVVRRSINNLTQLENMFETGVEGRTKYEVSLMKSDWARFNRLYAGVKQMNELPGAIVIVDPRYERVAVKESRAMGIPIIGLADSNCDPEVLDYVIPGNDDALQSIELVMSTLADAVIAGNEGKGITHNLKDYSSMNIEIVKSNSRTGDEEIAPVSETEAGDAQPKVKVKAESQPKDDKNAAGILGRITEEKERKRSEKKTA